MGKRVAVLMSTYNGECYIREQIDSILLQEGVEITLYIRDDGSTDSTCDIIREYSELNEKIICRFEDNVGPCESFLDLLFSLEGDFEYIAFSDQDDIWECNKLQRAIELLENDCEPSLYYSAIEKYIVENGVAKKKKKLTEYSFTEVLIKSCFPGCTMVINKKGMDLILHYSRPVSAMMHDWYIAQLFIGTNSRIVYDDKGFIRYRIHGNNVSVVGHSLSSKILHIRNILRNQKGLRLKSLEELSDILQEDMLETDRNAINTVISYKTNVLSLIKVLKLLKSTRFNNKIKVVFAFSFIFKIF